MKTELIYKTNMDQLECESEILEYKLVGGDNVKMILDRTPFYPKGGGQSADAGYIESDTLLIKVTNVYVEEGQVVHEGLIEVGEVEINTKVMCKVDKSIRDLHSRIHSAGHILDIAISELGYKLEPSKGYHFADGPYVEYVERSKYDLEVLKSEVESKLSEILKRGIMTRVEYDNKNLYAGEPTRLVHFANFSSMCAGTHVANTNQIGDMIIRKVKRDKDKIKVSYSVQ